MEPYSVQHICAAFLKVSESLVLYLPRTSDLRQVAALVPDSQRINAVHYCIRKASKVRAGAGRGRLGLTGRRYVCISERALQGRAGEAFADYAVDQYA